MAAFEVSLYGVEEAAERFGRSVETAFADALVEADAFALRLLAAVRARAPRGPEAPGWRGPHLADDFRMTKVSRAGSSAFVTYRIEPASDRGRLVLGILTTGTRPHTIVPGSGHVLAIAQAGGEVHFARYAHHPGTRPNLFVRDASRDADVRGAASRMFARFRARFYDDFKAAPV